MGARWKKTSGPWPYSEGSDGADVAARWVYTLRRGADERNVRVDLTNTAALTAHLPEDVQRAIQSDGWSAIVPYLDDDEPPTRIVISTAGVAPAEIGAAQKMHDPQHG